jgi:hypothetical protein
MNSPVRQDERALKRTGLAPAGDAVAIGLNAAILAVRQDEPMVAVVTAGGADHAGDGALPCGLFSAQRHHSLEDGVRFWARQQTGIGIGFAQQLCTFGHRPKGSQGARPSSQPLIVSICYLALVGPAQHHDRDGAVWHSWYRYLPWEDWRHGRPECLRAHIEPRLAAWAHLPALPDRAPEPLDRAGRVRVLFGRDGAAWDEEKVLERYELLCEAGLIGDGERPGPATDASWRLPRLAHPLLGDQTRVLASAVGELRRTIKCRPVVFELMAEAFTLFELQKTVEAILGPHLHKQNFRRLVEGCGLVEPTGDYRLRTGGRPAQLFRFRHDVLLERLAPGVRIKPGR